MTAPDRTPGRWCQFHPSYCPEAEGAPFSTWDTSHDVSAILPDGTRYHVAHFRHASDASFVENLVNGHEALRAERDALAARVEAARDSWQLFKDALCFSDQAAAINRLNAALSKGEDR